MKKIKKELENIKAKFDKLTKKQRHLTIYLLLALVFLFSTPFLFFGILIIGGVYIWKLFENPIFPKSKFKKAKIKIVKSK